MKISKTWIVTGSLATIAVAGIAGAATANGDRADRPFGETVTVPGYATPGAVDGTSDPSSATDSAITPGEAHAMKVYGPEIGKSFEAYAPESAVSAASPEVAPAPAPVVYATPAPAQVYSADSGWSAPSAASAWSAASADSGD